MRLLGDGWGACPLRSVCGVVLLHVPFHVGYVWHASACVELCFPIHNPHLCLELFTAPPEFHRPESFHLRLELFAEHPKLHRPVSFHLRLELFAEHPNFHRPISFHLRLELFTAPQNSTGLYPSTSAWSCSQRPRIPQAWILPPPPGAVRRAPEFHRPESFHLRLELFAEHQNSTGLYPSTSAWSCSQRPQNSTGLYPSTSAWSCSQRTQISTGLYPSTSAWSCSQRPRIPQAYILPPPPGAVRRAPKFTQACTFIAVESHTWPDHFNLYHCSPLTFEHPCVAIYVSLLKKQVVWCITVILLYIQDVFYFLNIHTFQFDSLILGLLIIGPLEITPNNGSHKYRY